MYVHQTVEAIEEEHSKDGSRGGNLFPATKYKMDWMRQPKSDTKNVTSKAAEENYVNSTC